MKEDNRIEHDIWDLLSDSDKRDEILNTYSEDELKELEISLLDIKYQSKYSKPNLDKVWEDIQASIPKKSKKKFLFTFLSYAASIVGVMILSLASYFILENQIKADKIEVAINKQVKKTPHDIAELTLSNGEKVNLSKMNKGALIKDLDVNIVNSSNNSLTYKTRKNSSKQLEYNTISVPKGGEYALTLSDGTVVRLNSESSLKFPIHFIENNRKVFLKGEAFFDVKKNKHKPFVVEVKNMNVKVLGTVFNINSYPENKDIKTTLVEGSVKVINTKNTKQSITIKPNEQAVFNANGIKKKRVNIKEYVSWVRGKFYFNDMSLFDVMRQIERWYNVDVVFLKNELKDFPFTGVINRSSSLEDTIRIIEKITKAKIRISEKKVIIEK